MEQEVYTTFTRMEETCGENETTKGHNPDSVAGWKVTLTLVKQKNSGTRVHVYDAVAAASWASSAANA